MGELDELTAITPADGRYRAQTAPLAPYLSEWGLIRERVRVEVEWLRLMAELPCFPEVRPLTGPEVALLEALVRDLGPEEARRVKEIERVTRHDVKAVEYWLRERLAGTSLEPLTGFLHFACTSEDINNLAYARMLQGAMREVWVPAAGELAGRVQALAEEHAALPMLARTHGQPATPTTLGKELAVFVARWRRQIRLLEGQEYRGKFNGASGTYAAHRVAYPDAPWEEISRTLVERLGLVWNPLTTQIEPHDWIAELLHGLCRFHGVLIDFDRDVWTYVSLGYFRQKVVEGEVGSSAMPHKVNPILFENSEANAGVASALLLHLADALLVSRLQRDLTDSSRLRNLGPAIGHSLIAVTSARAGVERLEVDREAVAADLDGCWEVLAEAVQTVLRRHGIPDAYERLKEITRGARVTREDLHRFLRGVDLPADARERLLALTPAGYTGLAAGLVRHAASPTASDEASGPL